MFIRPKLVQKVLKRKQLQYRLEEKKKNDEKEKSLR